MFSNWGAWLGMESERTVNSGDDETAGVNEDINNKHTEEEHGSPPHLLQRAKGFSGYILNFANSASKKLSESVAETAQSIKRSVEEGRIDGIIDKTILGDFQKEQNKFVLEKNAKKTDAAVPPWVGYNDEEETIQQQILALSADKRNFLRDPPAGVPFTFDCEQMYPVAMVMLEEDELLNRMRFHLVPKLVKEEAFWKNYFYRVSLIKQSAQLTVLAAQQQAADRMKQKTDDSNPDDVHQTEYVHQKTPPAFIGAKPLSNEEEEDISSTSPDVSEFVSDAFDSCAINQEDLRKDMEQLVLGTKRTDTNTLEEETCEWERILQEELSEYETTAADQENQPDDNWEKEMEEMLQVEEDII